METRHCVVLSLILISVFLLVLFQGVVQVFVLKISVMHVLSNIYVVFRVSFFSIDYHSREFIRVKI